jgi:hypothetical protein
MLKWSHCKVILLIECGFNEMVVKLQINLKRGMESSVSVALKQ